MRRNNGVLRRTFTSTTALSAADLAAQSERHVRQAVAIAKQLDRPVKVIWSREKRRPRYYRPCAWPDSARPGPDGNPWLDQPRHRDRTRSAAVLRKPFEACIRFLCGGNQFSIFTCATHAPGFGPRGPRRRVLSESHGRASPCGGKPHDSGAPYWIQHDSRTRSLVKVSIPSAESQAGKTAQGTGMESPRGWPYPGAKKSHLHGVPRVRQPEGTFGWNESM